MKPLSLLGQEQQAAVTHIYENDSTYLIGQMGSGKTVVALTAAMELLRDASPEPAFEGGDDDVRRVLVVAPPRVITDVWSKEHTTWSHLSHLNVGIARGTPEERLNVVRTDAEIVVLSFDTLPWFFETFGGTHGFDMLVIDEITKMKAGGVAFKALRKRLNDFKVRVVMTGTPVAESWTDLFYCMLACDGGALFGRNKQAFLNKYFYPVDFERRNWAILPHCIDTVTDLISDTVVVLPDYVDQLPPLTEEVFDVGLGPHAREYYDTFERDSINDVATADSAAVQVGKLQQIASGFIYPDEEYALPVYVHDEKLAAAGRLSQEGPTIFVYQFKEELGRLKERFPDGAQLGVSDKQDAATLALWRSGELEQLFLHPKSAGHGLDLTAGCRMVIMSPIWSRDLMRQVIARIWRRNQTEPCWVRILCAVNTVDGDIVAREQGKGGHMELLMGRLNKIKMRG